MNFGFTGIYDGKGRMPDIPKRAKELAAEEVADLVWKAGGFRHFLIEIGCNDGETTEAFLETKLIDKIYCFEPEPSAIAEWVERFRDHGVCSRPSLYTFACGHRDITHHDFFPSQGRWEGMPSHKQNWNLSGSLLKPTGHLNRDKQTSFGDPIQVEMRRLDMVFRHLAIDGTGELNDRVPFIWCDSQGSEARVILGARDILVKTCYFYTEFYDTPQYDRQPDLYGIYCMLPDFDPIGIFGDNCLFKNRDFA